MEQIHGIDLLEIGSKRTMIGIVLGGEDHYLLMFPEEEINPVALHEFCLSTEEWEKMLHQMDTLETEVTEGKNLPKIILRKSQRNIEQNVSWEVFRRDEFKCRYCGDDKSPMTVDHVITWETMGPSITKNLVCACKKCNRIRGNMSYEDWLQTDYYKKVSKNIQDRVKSLNLSLLEEIKSIPLRVHKRNR